MNTSSIDTHTHTYIYIFQSGLNMSSRSPSLCLSSSQTEKREKQVPAKSMISMTWQLTKDFSVCMYCRRLQKSGISSILQVEWTRVQQIFDHGFWWKVGHICLFSTPKQLRVENKKLTPINSRSDDIFLFNVGEILNHDICLPKTHSLNCLRGS